MGRRARLHRRASVINAGDKTEVILLIPAGSHVECYSGSEYAEYPKAFDWQGQRWLWTRSCSVGAHHPARLSVYWLPMGGCTICVMTR